MAEDSIVITHRNELSCYITKDGSEICELMHPRHHGNQLQSLAEARVKPGKKTQLHRHLQTEELYHIISGSGVMMLGNQRFAVNAGDTVCISAGVSHAVENNGVADLIFLCCCSPPYSHQDTELLKS